MKIEIWRHGEPIPSKSKLHGFTDTDQGSALIRAGGKTMGILRLSDDLALKLLGAMWQSCPEAGQLPLRHRRREGYFASELGGSVRLKCHTCGYSELVHPSHHLVHPDKPHLTQSPHRVAINRADWSEAESALTLPQTEGHLCICVRPQDSPVNTSAVAAKAAHPNARVVSRSGHVIILSNVYT